MPALKIPRLFLITCLLMLFAGNLHALPKEVLKDKYMMSLTQALKTKDYKAALPLFEKLEALKLPLSKSFLYFKGEALARTQQPLAAEKVLTQYIEKAGRKGKYYKPALKLLVEIESEQQQKVLPKKGNTWTDTRTGMEFVGVPGGCFMMGATPGNPGSNSWEKPRHRVCMKGFWVGRYEVTNAQWKKIMGTVPSEFCKKGDCPVTDVSWDDVQGFVERMNGKSDEGSHFNLPSEAQWEYACRGGVEGERYCGGNQPGDIAWYSKNSDYNINPVGRKKANGFGLFDMSGNVWEWTEDCLNVNYEGAPSDGAPWLSGDCSRRVYRGGSWGSDPGNLRAAYRFWSARDSRLNFLGFRLSRATRR